jgi:hypothetical protein
LCQWCPPDLTPEDLGAQTTEGLQAHQPHPQFREAHGQTVVQAPVSSLAYFDQLQPNSFGEREIHVRQLQVCAKDCNIAAKEESTKIPLEA